MAAMYVFSDSGNPTAMITAQQRSGEFSDFLKWLLEDAYADREHVHLFLDNCSIHHTKAERKKHHRKAALSLIG